VLIVCLLCRFLSRHSPDSEWEMVCAGLAQTLDLEDAFR
jgi:hypothetical protein